MASTLQSLVKTTDRRFWMVAGLGTFAALLVLGVPTAVIPNPFFIRMTPTDAVNVLTLVASAPLFGIASLAILALTLRWWLTVRIRGCIRCSPQVLPRTGRPGEVGGGELLGWGRPLEPAWRP